jgi:hypothetical protein
VKSLRLEILLIVAMFIFALVGCYRRGAGTTPVADSTPNVSNAIGRAGVYVDNAKVNVKEANPYTDDTGKIYLRVAGGQLLGASDELEKANTELGRVRGERDKIIAINVAIQADRNAWKSKYDTLYKTWGATIERWFWRIVGILIAFWAITGIVSVVLMIVNPLGVGGMFARQLLHLMPFSNLFWAAHNRFKE